MVNAWAHQAKSLAMQGSFNWSSDTIKFALMASAYTPASPLTNVHWSDVSASELAAGSGYTTGGVTLGSKTITETEANSWSAQWAATTAYTTGNIIRPTAGNGHLFRCIVAGTSGGAQPTWITASFGVQGLSGATETQDGTVTWEEAGSAITVLSSAGASWTGLSATSVRYGWIYDAQTGVASTEPLICLVDFGSSTWTSANVTISPDATLGWVYDMVS